MNNFFQPRFNSTGTGALGPVLSAAVDRALLMVPKGSFHRIWRPLGSRIECISGLLWITIDGDPRDVVLAQGQSLRVDRSSLLLMQALEASALHVEPAACAREPPYDSGPPTVCSGSAAMRLSFQG